MVRTSHTRRLHTPGVEQRGRFLGRFHHLPDRENADVVALAHLAGAAAVPHLVGGHVTSGGLRPPQRNRARRDAERLLEHHADLFVGRRREDRDAGDLGEQGEVEQPVMAGPVVAGDARAVDAEHDGQRMQADVVDDLVPRAAEERGVDGDDWPQSTHGHTRGRGHGVLLGDADVEAPIGETLGERQQAGGARAFPR